MDDVSPAGTKREAIDRLNEEVRSCTRCRLAATRTHALCGEGSLDARLLLVALAPGAREDLSDAMFVGPSGPVLDRLLGAAGISRETIYMTNLIKCLLPKNRRPKMAEIEACRPFVEREIAIVRPRVVVPLGYYATRTVLTAYRADPPPARRDFRPLYASLIVSDDQAIFPLPHPSFLLYSPALEPGTAEMYSGLAPLIRDAPVVP
ncbi:MAG: uracil-DNA glycosylase [Deltaproteobacteria bacterium]|nr:uracil-DNA glycosylase [Deltaproteobacteria bacterium]